MESIAELRRICRRENDGDNRRTMFLASRVSIHFTRLFLRLGLSANQVTALFMTFGAAGAVAFLGQGVRWAVAGYVLHRLHVICDVSDGEVARYRRTFSALGAYLDFLTHYFVYNVIAFTISYRYFLDSGAIWGLVCGFALALSMTMNRAATDCWFRATFGTHDRNEIEEGRRGQARSSSSTWRKRMILAAAHAGSMQNFLSAYLTAVIVERLFEIDVRGVLLPVYVGVSFVLAIARIALTIARGRIPRRATYY